ncbi:chromosomal replication initiator protein DnaA [Deltaproteobacteria bacterium]|nr:chromosomal replication initiator protein DnaA [Deltaproteobacteria bacterium]
MQDQWTKISENLKKMLDSGTFKVWIVPLRVVVQGDRLCIGAPNAFVADWLRQRMLLPLREAAAPVLGLAPESVDVRIEAAGRDAAAGQAVSGAGKRCPPEGGYVGAVRAGLRQILLPLPVPGSPSRPEQWRYSFDDFEVGVSNSVAVAAAHDVCNSAGSVRTLFVNSSSGLGKTHLSHAVGRTISESRGNARVGYLTAEEFARRFVAALRSHDVESFKARLRDLDVLLLEDVHFFQGKEKMQDMALTVVKNIEAKGGRTIFTSSFSPRELQHIDSQLVSYFCSGILTRMDRPSKEMRRRLLARKAKSFQVLLPDAVCDFLASRLKGDIRQLESCLESLIFKARLLNCGLDQKLAMEVLAQYAGVECGPADMEAIIRLVCESYGLSENQLNSRSRRQECVLGRNTIYYLARKHTDLSLEEIGEKFNRRHSTVIKGITSVEREISKESTLGRQIAKAVHLIERNAGLGVIQP